MKQNLAPIAIFLLLIVGTSTSLAQTMAKDFTYSWHPLERETGPDPFIEAAYKIDNGYLIIKKEAIRGPGGYRYFLEKRDADMNVTETKNISEQIDENNYVINGFYQLGDNFILLSTGIVKEELRKVMYVQKVDLESFNFSERVKVFDRTFENRRQLGRYGFFAVRSRNKQFMAINYGERSEDDELILNYTLLDKNGEPLYEKEKIKIDLDESRRYISDMVVSDEGNVLYLIRKEEYVNSEDRRIRKDVKTSYTILSGNKDGESFNEVVQEGTEYERLYLEYTLQGDLFLSGFYKSDDGYINGSLLLKLDPESGNVINTTKHEFSKEFILEGKSDRASKKLEKKEERGKDIGISNLVPIKYLSHEDESFSVIGEVQYITSRTVTTSNGATRTTYYYHYDDLIITRYSSAGDIISENKVIKKNTYVNGPRPGFLLFDHNNDILFVDDLHSKEFIEGFDELPRAEKSELDGHIVGAYRVDPNGNESLEGLLPCIGERRGYRKYNIGNDAFLLSNNEILITTYYGRKEFGIGRISPIK